MTAPVTTSAAPATAAPARPAATGHGGFQPEIQGLRAVAVLLVVVFHLWPTQLTGGFVGVDVFFVISGYLITAHIFREVQRTGTISLRRFWARRIRRLLPASLLVLALSAAATVLFLPPTVWSDTARQIAASALYVQNWALAGDAVDYMAQDNVPTVAQHYWSLSVEEQFYLVWPILVLTLVALTGRYAARRANGVRAVLAVGIGALGAISLVWSIIATAREASTAYFVTPTRVWEFAVGALLGLGVVGTVRGRVAHVLLGGAGLIAVITAGMIFDGESLFPGWIALLPVLGTAAVIAAGYSGTPLTPGWLLSRRPMTFVGDISYSVYLWHWPLIICVPYVTGVDLRTVDKLGIFAATLVLAWLSKAYVEDPMRRQRTLSAVPWRSFAFAGAGMAVVVAGTVGITTELDRRADAAEASAESVLGDDVFTTAGDDCVGPAAMEDGCGAPEGSDELVVPPEVVVEQNHAATYPGCQQGITTPDVKTCTIGSESETPDRVVALVGDSHTTHWFATFDALGRERNWQVITYTKASCPVTHARRLLDNEQTDEAGDSCLAWGREVEATIAADERISAVFTSAFSSAYEFADADTPLDDPAADGFGSVWQSWSAAGKQVYVIRDVPPTRGDDSVPDCLLSHPDRNDCATAAEDLPDDPQTAAVDEVADPRVHLVDLTDRFCDDSTCYAVVGDLVVYRDTSHLTDEYARALAPYLAQQVDAAESAGD
ncbi:acyltransferase family protein [Jiangella asiatica]|uniref:Acyltransferase n=1 Tax=Jiangella asiatica TaxID=2530372 RepID=A0A4R5DNI8_9ACTN|nr:acyltransferase family protein [Jiangella asiatica]TDE15896.1 acyltransferase [Jiangella asiatica]